MRRLVRLTESDLHRIVSRSARRVISELINPINPYDLRDRAEDEDEYDSAEDYGRAVQRFAGDIAMDEHPQRDDRSHATCYVGGKRRR